MAGDRKGLLLAIVSASFCCPWHTTHIVISKEVLSRSLNPNGLECRGILVARQCPYLEVFAVYVYVVCPFVYVRSSRERVLAGTGV